VSGETESGETESGETESGETESSETASVPCSLDLETKTKSCARSLGHGNTIETWP
jgi:hypothetical protein